MNAAQAVEPNERTVWVRWTIDHVKEWVRRTWMANQAPKDYDVEEENSREVMRILRQLIARPSGNSYYEGGNGEKRTLNWILGVLSLLLVGAVGGGVSLYGKVSSLETRVTEWQKASERESNETRRRLDRLESR